PRPTGTLAEQFLQAEAMNLQLSVGMGLAHRWAPNLVPVERRLDLVFPTESESAGARNFQLLPATASPAPYQKLGRFFDISMSSLDGAVGGSSSPSSAPHAKVSRTIPPASTSQESREYELRVEDFSNFLNPGHQSVIAVREGREFWLQLGHRERTKSHDR